MTIPVLIILSWLVKSTRQGKAMRATSQDPQAAAIMGINVNRTITFTFALAGALAGIGARSSSSSSTSATTPGSRSA